MTTFLLLGVLPIAGAWLLVELIGWALAIFGDRWFRRGYDAAHADNERIWQERVDRAVRNGESEWLTILAAVNGGDFKKWNDEMKGAA